VRRKLAEPKITLNAFEALYLLLQSDELTARRRQLPHEFDDPDGLERDPLEEDDPLVESVRGSVDLIPPNTWDDRAAQSSPGERDALALYSESKQDD